jgi:DNA-binding NarL/FixJ family response regulator
VAQAVVSGGGPIRRAGRDDDFLFTGSSHVPPCGGDEHGLDGQCPDQEVTVVSLDGSELAPAVVAKLPRADADRSAANVLVVDDQDVFRRQLRAGLELEGFEVAEARSGEAALERASRLRPDVVVMDTKMPGMSGIEATRRLLRSAPQTAVIMLSMFDGDELIEMAVDAGASAYLVKDAELEQVVAAIQAALGRSRRFRTPHPGDEVDLRLCPELSRELSQAGAAARVRELRASGVDRLRVRVVKAPIGQVLAPEDAVKVAAPELLRDPAEPTVYVRLEFLDLPPL